MPETQSSRPAARRQPCADAQRNRERLLEVEKLTAAGQRFADKMHPLEALRACGAIISGELRADTNPDDFVRALVGIFHPTALPGWEPSARRIVDILIAGSSPKNEQLRVPLRAPKK